MKRMIDLIKQSAIPANMMRSAAKGALSVPPGEMFEILVYLTNHPMFAEEARTTLASWEEKGARYVLEDPKCSVEVLQYFLSDANVRIPLLSSILDNPAVTDDMMVRFAMEASSGALANMLWHPRVLANKSTLHAISMNVNLPDEDKMVVRSALANLGEDTSYLIEQAEADPNELFIPEHILDEEVDRYTYEHADEIAAEEAEDVRFVLYVDAAPRVQEKDAPLPEPIGPVISGTGDADKLTEDAIEEHVGADPSIRKKMSTLQKISKLPVGERIKLAMKGSKDERFILVRDGSKVVSAAVLESPKLTDQEVETFASLKNVQEGVLRSISMKRKFMRNYVVQRNLVNNPRVPLDITLPLLKGLMINDLRAMSANKNVNDTLRKMAFKLYKQRSEKKQDS